MAAFLPPLPGRILVLGHSYVRRLHDYCNGPGAGRYNLALDTSQVAVSFHGIGGAKIAALWAELGRISALQPDV